MLFSSLFQYFITSIDAPMSDTESDMQCQDNVI